MILVTQFREEVKYCRDEKKQQCFAKRLKEGCGESEKELGQSIAGPACTNQKGKALGNVFLIKTSDSDNCAIVGVKKVIGVKKVKIQEGDVAKDMVLAHLEIAIPGSEADRASDADKWVNATSCKAFGSTPSSFSYKFIALIFQLCGLFVKRAWKNWEVTSKTFESCENLKSCMEKVFCTTTGIGYMLLLIVFMLHPCWIFIPNRVVTNGCDQYKIVCGYELGLAIWNFIHSTYLLGLLAKCYGSTWQGENSKPKFGCFAAGNVILTAILIISDALGLVDVKSAAAEKQCYYFPEHLQIATIALNGFSFLAQGLVNCVRNCSGVSGTEPKSEDRVLESSLGYGGGRMPGQPGAADAPAEGDAHSEGSAFSDHDHQDSNAQDAARKADEDKDTPYSKGGQPIVRV